MPDTVLDMSLVTNDIKLKLKDNGDGTYSPYVETELDATGVTIAGDLSIASIAAGDTNIGNVDLASSIPAGNNNIGDVDIASIAASEAHIGQVTGSTINVAVTPAITAGAYHANDVVGVKTAIANASRASGVPTTLQSLVIQDLAMQNAALTIFLFNADPSTGTYTDNAECDIDDTDLAKCVGVLTTGDGQWLSAKDNSIFVLSNIGLVMTPAVTSLWMVVKCTGTPTYASIADLTFRFGFFRE